MKGGGGGGGVPRFAGEAEDRSTAAFNRFRSRIFPRCGENGRNEGRNRSGNQATLAYVSRAHDTKQPGRKVLSSKSNNFPFRTHRAGSRDVASFVKKVWKGETKIFKDGKFIFSDGNGGDDSRTLIDLGDNSINK